MNDHFTPVTTTMVQNKYAVEKKSVKIGIFYIRQKIKKMLYQVNNYS